MVHVEPLALPHVVAALQAEIAALRKTHAECGENWPADFDPNDIGDFQSVLDELRSTQSTQATIENAWSKPAQFTATLIARYMSERKDRLEAAELNALSRLVTAIRGTKFPSFDKVERRRG